jgi:hypothetical protein
MRALGNGSWTIRLSVFRDSLDFQHVGLIDLQLLQESCTSPIALVL